MLKGSIFSLFSTSDIPIPSDVVSMKFVPMMTNEVFKLHCDKRFINPIFFWRLRFVMLVFEGDKRGRVVE